MVPAYPGCPGKEAVKRVFVYRKAASFVSFSHAVAAFFTVNRVRLVNLTPPTLLAPPTLRLYRLF